MTKDMTETSWDILRQLAEHSKMQLEWNQSNDSFRIGKWLGGNLSSLRGIAKRSDAMPIIEHGYVKRVSKCGNYRAYAISPAGLRALENGGKADRNWKSKNVEPIGNPDGGTEHICDLANGWKLGVDCTINPPSYYVAKNGAVHLVSDQAADNLRSQYSEKG